ncbi:hypothetical protein VTO73DRAFT_10081 [Trametes versicolor]
METSDKPRASQRGFSESEGQSSSSSSSTAVMAGEEKPGEKVEDDDIEDHQCDIKIPPKRRSPFRNSSYSFTTRLRSIDRPSRLTLAFYRVLAPPGPHEYFADLFGLRGPSSTSSRQKTSSRGALPRRAFRTVNGCNEILSEAEYPASTSTPRQKVDLEIEAQSDEAQTSQLADATGLELSTTAQPNPQPPMGVPTQSSQRPSMDSEKQSLESSQSEGSTAVEDMAGSETEKEATKPE